MPASSFIADFFSASAGSIYLCSLPNERNGGQVAELCGRGGGVRLDDLVHQWDRKDRGTFFCVSTLVPKQSKRCKDTVFEITCLHADIDFAKIDVSPEVAERRQASFCACLPRLFTAVTDCMHTGCLARRCRLRPNS